MIVSVADGLSFYVSDSMPSDDFVLKEVFNDLCYGPLESFGDFETVIDVGANIGVVSIMVAHHSYAKVYAFEPEPENFALLIRNIALNHMEDQIVPINVGISDGHDVLFMEKGRGGNTDSRFVSQSGFETKVSATTLDEVFKDYEMLAPLWLKVDTEGHEPHVFNGISDENLKKVDEIAMEYHGITDKWGPMIRRLSGAFILTLDSHDPPNYNYGGMCYGKRKNE